MTRTSSIDKVGTSATIARRMPLANAGVMSRTRNRASRSPRSMNSTSYSVAILESAVLWAAGPVVRDRCHVLDTTDFEAGASERSDRRLCARTGVGLLVAARTANANVDAFDALGLDLLCDGLGHLHRRVRRRFVAVLFDDRPTGGLRERLRAGLVRDGDDRVVERCVHVGDAPDVVRCFLCHGLLLLRALGVEFVRQRARAVELDGVLLSDGHLRGRLGHAPAV